jgi:peptidoglycan-N-acetylglucosamine deacetylase
MEKVLLTFDLEYWFESESIQQYLDNNETDTVGSFITELLNLLKQTNSTATFFVTNKILSNEPDIIKQIFNAGHEIAVHSSDHKPLWSKNSEIFEKEIHTMVNKIENLTSKKPIGHRAVNFSLNQKTVWSLEVLKNNNFKYDSSIFPFKFPSFLKLIFGKNVYGNNSNFYEPYKIDFMWELPISVWHKFKFKLPLTGGIYIRMIPWLIFKTLLNWKLKKEMACIHFHPFDFATKIPNIKMPIFKKFLKYYNTKNTWKKLEYIVKRFNCISIEKYLYENPTN